MTSPNSRYVEAEHAKVQVGLRKAPHHSDAYVSLLRRMCGLTKEIKQNPPVLQDLAKHLESVRSGRDAVRILGLDGHHSFVPGCRDRVAWSIVYHADAYTKFTMPDPDLFFQTGPPPKDEPGHKALGDASDICKSLMLEHLSSTHSSSSDVVFSMEFESAGFQSLTHVLQGVPSLTPLALEDVPHPVDPEAFDVLCSKQQDVDMCLHAAQVMKSAKARNLVFWKPVQISASRVKRPTLSHESSLKNKFLVAMRRLLDVNTKDQTLLVSVEAENRNMQEGGVLTPLVFAPSLLSIESLKSMKIWKPRRIQTSE